MELTINPLVVGLTTALIALLKLPAVPGTTGRAKAILSLLVALALTAGVEIRAGTMPASAADWIGVGFDAIANGLASMGLWSGGKAVGGK